MGKTSTPTIFQTPRRRLTAPRLVPKAARSGDYVIVKHYVVKGQFAARLLDDPSWDEDLEAFTAYFIAEDEDFTVTGFRLDDPHEGGATGFWAGYAVWVPDPPSGSPSWEIADGGYANACPTHPPAQWMVPDFIRDLATPRKDLRPHPAIEVITQSLREDPQP